MLTDPIADMLTRIRNANMVRHNEVEIPYSKLKHSLANILKEEGYIEDILIFGDKPSTKTIKCMLKYDKNQNPIIKEISRVSKPGRRVYFNLKELKENKNKVIDGLGILVLSTSKGILSNRECMKLNLGGEVLCKVW